jgi:hypothetical protein
LVEEFLKTYKINLLSIPRESADVGDAYVATPQGVFPPGRLWYLLTPDFQMPKVRRNERMTDIAGTKTRALELKLGIKLLEDFVSAIGADLAIDKVRAEYEHKRTGNLRFSLKNATRDSVDPFEFGLALAQCRLDEKQPFIAEENRYYVSVGVVRSPSITVSAEDENSNAIDVDVGALKGAIGVESKLDIERGSKGELTYRGKIPLAFGVELVEMAYDIEQQKFLLTAMRTAVPIRDEMNIEKTFIGDAEHGSVFIL